MSRLKFAAAALMLLFVVACFLTSILLPPKSSAIAHTNRYFVSPPQEDFEAMMESEHQAPPVPQGGVVLIVLARRPELEANYLGLEDDSTHIAFRNTGFGLSDPQIQRWNKDGTPYYLTVASSDFPSYLKQPLYLPVAETLAAIEQPANEGLYLHEVVTYLASRNGWRWPEAAEAVDWKGLEQVINAAAAAGKKVIWSEAADGWEALGLNPQARQLLERTAGTLIPMFATNFDAPRSGYFMRKAGADAQAVARRYGLKLGQSHQSWHFRDRDVVPSREGSLALARVGREYEATYFQIEGTEEDLAWDSPYLLGIRDFLALLGPAT
jgi:hypothetical protein